MESLLEVASQWQRTRRAPSRSLMMKGWKFVHLNIILTTESISWLNLEFSNLADVQWIRRSSQASRLMETRFNLSTKHLDSPSLMVLFSNVTSSIV